MACWLAKVIDDRSIDDAWRVVPSIGGRIRAILAWARILSRCTDGKAFADKIIGAGWGGGNRRGHLAANHRAIKKFAADNHEKNFPRKEYAHGFCQSLIVTRSESKSIVHWKDSISPPRQPNACKMRCSDSECDNNKAHPIAKDRGTCWQEPSQSFFINSHAAYQCVAASGHLTRVGPCGFLT